MVTTISVIHYKYNPLLFTSITISVITNAMVANQSINPSPYIIHYYAQFVQQLICLVYNKLSERNRKQATTNPLSSLFDNFLEKIIDQIFVSSTMSPMLESLLKKCNCYHQISWATSEPGSTCDQVLFESFAKLD